MKSVVNCIINKIPDLLSLPCIHRSGCDIVCMAFFVRLLLMYAFNVLYLSNGGSGLGVAGGSNPAIDQVFNNYLDSMLVHLVDA